MTASAPTQHVIVVSGLSGAGKSTALKALEDMGYHCIDNLPPALLDDFAQHLKKLPERYDRVALGMDVRTAGDLSRRLPDWLDGLRADQVKAQLLFLDARDSTLLKRYGETRRRHPLASDQGSLAIAIEKERQLLEPLRALASWTIDTSETNIHQLTHETWRHVGADTDSMTIVLQSFGFSKGVPVDADYIFDVRCLPNPHWDDALRPLTGRDPAVAAWLEKAPLVEELAKDLERFLLRWLPEHDAAHRSIVTVAIGCTGGRHRSVYLTERLANQLSESFPEVVIHHRESPA